MFKNILVITIGAFLIAQVCKADELEDAGAALNELRQTTSESLNAGFLEHIKMATDVETAALDAKEAGGEDVAACVDGHAVEAIEYIYKVSSELADRTLKVTYDEEIEIIKCGASDAECLTGVIDDIKGLTDGVAALVNEEIEANREEVNGHIEAMQACA